MPFSMISIYSSDQLQKESSVRVLQDRAVLGVRRRTYGKMHQNKNHKQYYMLHFEED